MENISQPPVPPADAAAVHPGIEPISYLLGTWKGQGEGGFPTINSFSYGEELRFTHHSYRPVIAYTQKTWKLNSGEPMHAESGFWRPKPDGFIEVVIAQSTGLAEVLVKEITRVFRLIGGDLSYEVEMATNSTSLQPHLRASLKKL
ncbi:UPF0678 fatty acid-binding protein-like protein At1g79260 isoform X2 [Juglans microcarpa x Juglans regia]|uniref:UPF0678 fatty acid-binding protein-like protein At1g79260 isoform X2 n=1 Tax=Juglans microcarpa x Juglans regia TaxID=2249226 RepID=UPI001B7EAE7C|nr:UPF0678 fatty acid-binding protein-like protein At1g79260 isoform X2 [Juglans microcarpa x Juglans regia]